MARKGKGQAGKAALANQRDELLSAALNLVESWLAYGPVDDGTPQGEAFEVALTNFQVFVVQMERQVKAERE